MKTNSKARMDESKDKLPDSNQKVSGRKQKNLAMEVAARKKRGNPETKGKILEDEVGRLKGLIAELKWNLIAVNKGIVARQDTIDQLTKRKQELLKADKEPTTSDGLSGTIFSKTNVAVDLADNRLARDAIELFPEEVWELIFAKLTDPQDLRNCSSTCQLFDRVLHPLKPSFLFLGVFPHLCPYLDNNLILSCRRVCKGWNEGVDNFVENHPARLPLDQVSWNPRSSPPTKNGLFRLEFTNNRGDLRERNFLKKMRRHPRNPFVGRAVSIRINRHYEGDFDDDRIGGENDDGNGNDDDEDDWEEDPIADDDDDNNWETDDESDHEYEGIDGPLYPGDIPDFLPPAAIEIPIYKQKKLFWEALLNFLHVFGKHIWYLSFYYSIEGSFIRSEVSGFQFLTEQIFLFAPNLRVIQFDGYLPSPSRFMLGPPPLAPKLETLRIDRRLRCYGFDSHCKGSVSKTVIYGSFRQLKQLHVDCATWKLIFKAKLKWTDLTELYITNDIDGFGQTLEAKQVVPSRMSQLRKLGLTHGRTQCKFEEIMKIVIGLSATTNLHVLRLFGEIEKEEVLQAPSCLFAPSTLKSLEMDGKVWRDDKIDYTFLLRFPLLENLVIFFDKEAYLKKKFNKIMEGQVVADSGIVELDTCMIEGRVYECGIWELLPRLKVFTIGRDVYTRECYERIMSRKRKS